MLASITNHNHAIADLRAQSRSGWEQSTGQNGSKQRQRGQAKRFPHENPHSTKRLHATVSIPFVQHACSRSLGGRSKTCAQDRRLRHGAAKQCATWSGAGAHAPQAKQRQPKLGGKHGGDHQAVKLVNAHRRHAGRTDLNRQLRRGRRRSVLARHRPERSITKGQRRLPTTLRKVGSRKPVQLGQY